MAPVIGWTASAIATTLAGWAMVWMLWRGARAMGAEARFDERFRSRLPRIVIASALMGLVLWLLALALAPMFQTAGLRYLALALLVAAGMASYAALGQATGAFRYRDLGAALRR